MTTVRLSDLSRTPATPVEQSATVAIPHGNQRECVCVCVCVGGWVLGGGACLQSYHYTPPSPPSSAALFSRFCSPSSPFGVLDRPAYCVPALLALWGHMRMSQIEDFSGRWGRFGRGGGEMNRMMSASVLSRVINITTPVRSHSPPSLSLSGLKRDFATLSKAK